MDEVIKQGQWWLLLLVPGLLALLGSRYGSILARRSEQTQWMRNKKQEAYADFIGHMRITHQESLPAVFEIVGETPPAANPDLEAEEERLRAYWQLELVSNDSVAEVARQLMNDLSSYRHMVANSKGLLKTYTSRVANFVPSDTDAKRAELRQNFHNLVVEERQAEILKSGFEAVRKRIQWLVQLMRDDLGLTTKVRFPSCDGTELKKLATEHDKYRDALRFEGEDG